MDDLHYFAAYTDSGCLIGCEHEHATVISAVACCSRAGSYVIAVESGELRELNSREEVEFQFAMYGHMSTMDKLRRLSPFRLHKPIVN
jgi:hypothetical protein